MWQTALALLIAICAVGDAKVRSKNLLPQAQDRPQPPQLSSTKEELALRRLKFFIAAAELDIAKQQSAAFLRDYPKSKSADRVLSWSVDIALCQGQWADALAQFDQIGDEDLKARKLPLAMHCFYCLERADQLVNVSSSALYSASLQKVSNADPLKFYRAEGLLLQSEQLNERGATLQTALTLYQELLGGMYGLRALEASADIYCRLEQVDNAQGCVDQLQALDPEHVKTVHFDALAALIESGSGLRTFAKTDWVKSLNLDQRALRWLALCFDLKRFDQVIGDAEELSPQLSHQARPFCAFLVGRSLLQIGKFQESIAPLQFYLEFDQSQLIESKSDLCNQRKAALLSLFQIGSELRDPDLLDRAIALWPATLPPSDEMANALFQRAQLRQKSDPESALKDLCSIAHEFPDSHLQKEALVGSIALAGRLNKWRLCSDLGVQLIELDPHNPKIAELCPLLVQAVARDESTIQDDSEAADHRHTAFQALLQLRQKQALAPAQLNQRYLELAENLRAAGSDQAALKWLNMVAGSAFAAPQKGPLADLPISSFGEYEAGYVRAICQSLQDADDLQPDEALCLYQAIFNDCAQQYANGSLAHCESMQILSAEALYRSFEAGAILARANLIWLGDHYFGIFFKEPFTIPSSVVKGGMIHQPQTFLPSKIAEDEKEQLIVDRAIAIYRHLLDGSEKINGFFFDESKGDLEQSAFRCARLLGASMRYCEQLAVLVHLNGLYGHHSSKSPWKELVRFELALVADRCNASEIASETYRLVLADTDASWELVDWMNWRFAINDLKSAQVLKKGVQSVSQKRAHRVLQQLQQRRNAKAEPLYLEAALLDAEDGIDISGGAREQRALENVKQLFAQSDGEVSERDYLCSLAQLPFQKKMHKDYMRWVDAKVAQLIADRGGQQSKAQRQFSQTIFGFLAQEDQNAPLIAKRAAQECGPVKEETAQ